MRGIILYSGPSVIDGQPIVVIATLKSNNRKTGDMIQIWIIREDIDPVLAITLGEDSSICGDCVHRGDDDRPRTCYVNVGQAPLAVYRAYKRGVYKRGTMADLPDRPVRMGAYGDPCAVPWEVWEGITDRKVWTGYTHQWRQPFAAPFRDVLMASCDSVADMAEAAANGWRAFLVTPANADRPDGTITCPSETHGTQCADCGLCKGAAIPNAPNISIPAHGSAKAFVQAG
jgi:hypothetical protein